MSDSLKKALEQLEEDREMFKTAYVELKKQLVEKTDWAVAGMVLAKFGELILKGSSQVADIAKEELKKKKPEDEESLSEDDIEDINAKIESGTPDQH